MEAEPVRQPANDLHTTAITLHHDPEKGLKIVASPGALVIVKWLWSKLWPLLAAALVGKHYLP